MAIFKGDQPEILKSSLTYILPLVLIVVVVFCVYWFLWSERSGSISVASSIPGAEVLINSSPTNQNTPVIIKRLRADSYEISVRLEGYVPSPKRQLVQVENGSRIAVSFSMVPDTVAVQSLGLVKTEVNSDSVPQLVNKTWTPTLDSLKKLQQVRNMLDNHPRVKTVSHRETKDYGATVFASVKITSSQDGALIWVDDVSTGFRTPGNMILTRGSHVIKVEKEGYRCDPEVIELTVTQSGQTHQAHFELIEQTGSEDRWALIIRTENAEGTIFLDDRYCAVGEYQVRTLPYGEYLVSYGDVDGYAKPEPQKIMLTRASPSADLVGVYHAIVHVMAMLDGSGEVQKNGVSDVINGVYFQDNGFTEDDVRGPAIKFLDDRQFYAWELGYGYAERNPPGMDCMRFLFDLPKGFNRDKPVRMQVFGYGSNHNYPFSFRNKTEIALYLNGAGLHTSFQPSFNVDEEYPLGYDVFDVTRYLKEGENILTIRTTENSQCFFYLNKIVLQ